MIDDDRMRRRLIARLNRRPMPVKWQIVIGIALSAIALLAGALGLERGAGP